MSLIVVQRGHVPRTSGATGAPGEQQFAIDTAAALAPLLRSMGHNVRVIDADEPSSQYRGDLFVAIHYDSSSSASASGASVGYQNGPGRRLAEMWKRHYRAEGWTRGFRADNYSVNLAQYYGVRTAIGQGNEAAIITESGFHSNTDDKKLLSPTRTARSIAAAIGEYTGTTMEDDMPTADEIAKALMDEEIPNRVTDGPPLTLRSWLSWMHHNVWQAKQAAVSIDNRQEGAPS